MPARPTIFDVWGAALMSADVSGPRLRQKRSVSPTFFAAIPQGYFDDGSDADIASSTIFSDDKQEEASPVSPAALEFGTIQDIIDVYGMPADYKSEMTSSWSSATTIRVQSSTKYRVKKICKTIKNKLTGKDFDDDYVDYF